MLESVTLSYYLRFERHDEEVARHTGEDHEARTRLKIQVASSKSETVVTKFWTDSTDLSSHGRCRQTVCAV